MRILFAGNNKRGIVCFDHLLRKGYNIVAAISHPPVKEEGGHYSSIREVVTNTDIPLYHPENINSDDFVEIIRTKIRPDLIILVGYAQLIKEKILEIPKHGCINLHASPLPYYRGAAPLNWMLINGEKKGALSIIKVDEGVDTGDILKQITFEIKKDYDINNLIDISLKEYPNMLCEVIDEISSGKCIPHKQDPENGSYFTKRFPQDGYINFTLMNAEQIHNKIRALTRPYPGAFSFYNKNQVLLLKSSLIETNYFGIPGRIAAKNENSMIVICKDRGIRLDQVEIQNNSIDHNLKFFKVGTDFDK